MFYYVIFMGMFSGCWLCLLRKGNMRCPFLKYKSINALNNDYFHIKAGACDVYADVYVFALKPISTLFCSYSPRDQRNGLVFTDSI